MSWSCLPVLAFVGASALACDGRPPTVARQHTPAHTLAHTPARAPARRIVSLLPSATDVLLALGTGDRLVGRTTYDIDSSLRALPAVGGATTPSVEAILGLAPDLVVVWQNVADRGLERQLTAAGVAVVSLPALDTTDLFTAIDRLGALTARDSAARALAVRLRAELDDVRRSVAGTTRPSVLYVAWNNPLITAGPRTFVGQLIGLAGGEPAFPELSSDWPTVALEDVVRRQPDVLVFPAGEMQGTTADALARVPGWRDLAAVRQGRVVQLPMALVNRSGPHVAAAARALRDALHPELARTER